METAERDVIATAALTKRFGTKTVVDDVTLHVRPGEIYGFLGLNGAGKTTTIRMLLAMIRPSAGDVHLFGEPARANARDLWRRVGYLVETPTAYPQLTVRENLTLMARLRDIRRIDAVSAVIKLLGLEAYADQAAGTLSQGNAQRLGLAKALIHRPDVLLLDEPVNGLDPAGVVEMRELLRRLAHEEGVTIFLSSHLLGEVARLATRVGIIHHGRLLQELDARDLDQQRRRWLVVDGRDHQAATAALASAGFTLAKSSGLSDEPLTITDERAIAAPDTVARLLVDAGAAPTRLVVEEEDLEQYFLRIVGEAAS